ncbi:MAG: DUF3037 domain-containing protein [Dehalococcoidia bacterium]
MAQQPQEPTERQRAGWYSYAIIRVVPRVERGEFVNTGVILFAPELRFLTARVALDPARVRALAPQTNVALIERHLQTFQAIAEGKPEGGPIAALPQSDRFHWLTAPRSTAIQTSPVHPGRCSNPDAAIADLLDAFVRSPPISSRERQRGKTSP